MADTAQITVRDEKGNVKQPLHRIRMYKIAESGKSYYEKDFMVGGTLSTDNIIKPHEDAGWMHESQFRAVNKNLKLRRHLDADHLHTPSMKAKIEEAKKRGAAYTDPEGNTVDANPKSLAELDEE